MISETWCPALFYYLQTKGNLVGVSITFTTQGWIASVRDPKFGQQIGSGPSVNDALEALEAKLCKIYFK